MRDIILGLGGNQPGEWGAPAATLRRCLAELASADLVPTGISRLYRTAPVGGPVQPAFLNAVVRVRSSLPPAGVLRVIKQLERLAGRRAGQRWGPRPLDIDIIADGGRINGWGRRGADTACYRRGSHPSDRPFGLAVPHPRLHQRAFVLVPLIDIAPYWGHPALRRPARALLADLGPRRRGVWLANESWP